MRNGVIAIVVLFVGIVQFSDLNAHCQVPCGIYDDHARVEAMMEDVATIEKSMRQITTLSGKTDALSKNQMTRWIVTKEKHAQSIIDTISNYFLTQRVKPASKDYVDRLVKHHRVILLAMKVKQTVDLKQVAKLKAAVKALTAYYPAHKDGSK